MNPSSSSPSNGFFLIPDPIDGYHPLVATKHKKQTKIDIIAGQKTSYLAEVPPMRSTDVGVLRPRGPGGGRPCIVFPRPSSLEGATRHYVMGIRPPMYAY